MPAGRSSKRAGVLFHGFLVVLLRALITNCWVSQSVSQSVGRCFCLGVSFFKRLEAQKLCQNLEGNFYSNSISFALVVVVVIDRLTAFTPPRELTRMLSLNQKGSPFSARIVRTRKNNNNNNLNSRRPHRSGLL